MVDGESMVLGSLRVGCPLSTVDPACVARNRRSLASHIHGHRVARPPFPFWWPPNPQERPRRPRSSPFFALLVLVHPFLPLSLFLSTHLLPTILLPVALRICSPCSPSLPPLFSRFVQHFTPITPLHTNHFIGPAATGKGIGDKGTAYTGGPGGNGL